MNISGAVDPQVVKIANKTITFTGGAGAGAIGTALGFTVTGRVLITSISGFATTALGGATATISLGVVGTVGALIAVTTATNIILNSWWVDASPLVGAKSLAAINQNAVVSTDILMNVLVAAITSGVLDLRATYIPLTAGASLT